MRERFLYPPVKSFLEAQGYEVKGEVNGCDLVAIRREEAPVIVELKTTFSLSLVFQGIARQGLSDNVYLAVPPFAGRAMRRRDALALCRRLGLGLLTVQLVPSSLVEALLDPAPYRPHRRRAATGRLLREFQHRVGIRTRAVPAGARSSRRTVRMPCDVLCISVATVRRKPRLWRRSPASSGPAPSCGPITMVGSNAPPKRPVVFTISPQGGATRSTGMRRSLRRWAGRAILDDPQTYGVHLDRREDVRKRLRSAVSRMEGFSTERRTQSRSRSRGPTQSL